MGLAGSLIYCAQNAQNWDLKQFYFQRRFCNLCSRLSPLPGGTPVTDRRERKREGGVEEGRESEREEGRKQEREEGKKNRRVINKVLTLFIC